LLLILWCLASVPASWQCVKLCFGEHCRSWQHQSGGVLRQACV
jgi:hypothetical protein